MTAPVLAPEITGLCHHPERLRPGNRVQLLRNGAEAYPRMLEAIQGARRSVHLETYIFRADHTGQRFADALIERARAGVDVRVLHDAVGCLSSGREFFGRMRAEGVKVIAFHPVLLSFAGYSYRRRLHRKLLIADGRVALLGGLNIAREYDTPEHGGLGWRDTHVEVEGPVVADLEAMFAELWNEERRAYDPLEEVPVDADPLEGGTRALVVSSLRFFDRWEISRHYLHAINKAKRRVWIANPYFLPSPKFRRAMRHAAQRGVDVRILLPSQMEYLPVLYAIQWLYADYLSWGIRLFEWPGTMMHAKTAVVDGLWSTVGSCNIDRRSLVHNHEVTAVVLDSEFGARMEAMFEDDLGRSREVRRDEWGRRPWRRRLLEDLCHSFRALM